MFKLVHVVRCRGFDLEDTLIVGAGPVGCDVASALANNPEFGLLPVTSPDPAHYRVEYEWGSYVIAKLDPYWTETIWVPLPGTYGDAALVVDALAPYWL